MSSKEKLSFQTEVKQLLQLMINSLYSNKEIFLRELISNAADAADKLRFLALEKPELLENSPDLSVKVIIDKKANTITIRDNGIGMSREEAINHLGTIAKSGSREFLANLDPTKAKTSELIGQFGVGFYSSFIVADKVDVRTRRAGLTANEGVLWSSTGEGDYEIETIEKAERGTDIILHLKKESREFLESHRVRHVITKYCDHINLPVMMEKEANEDEKKSDQPEFEAINKATALWTLAKKDIKEDEYKEFYKYIGHDYTDPLAWSHNRVEGKQEYISLLYLPARAPFDLYNQELKHGLKLYVQKIFIMDDAEHFLPRYLRFVKGIIDSKDLPLNVSREILQQNPLVEKIKSANIKRILSMMENLTKDNEEYLKFWEQFGKVLKEGPIEDHENKETIAKLLRFATTHGGSSVQNVSLDDYIARMKEGQDKIYYITSDSYAAAKNSPQLEVFAKKEIEVLLLTDSVDEWLVTHLNEYAGKSLQSVAQGDLDLGKLQETKPEEKEKQENEFASLLKQVKDVLSEQVKDVRLTDRLTQSPCCIVSDQNGMGLHMQKMLQAAGHAFPVDKPILELNPEHALIKHLQQETDDSRFADWCDVLFNQAVLADGGHLTDPGAFVQKMNKLLLSK